MVQGSPVVDARRLGGYLISKFLSLLLVGFCIYPSLKAVNLALGVLQVVFKLLALATPPVIFFTVHWLAHGRVFAVSFL